MLPGGWAADAGRRGAATPQEIAEVLEKEGNKEESIMFYEQAADLFATENSMSEANKCNLKVGGWVGVGRRSRGSAQRADAAGRGMVPWGAARVHARRSAALGDCPTACAALARPRAAPTDCAVCGGAGALSAGDQDLRGRRAGVRGQQPAQVQVGPGSGHARAGQGRLRMHSRAGRRLGRQAAPHVLHPYRAAPPRSAKGHLLNAGICQLCSADVTTIRNALERYRDVDINFDNSRECNFLAVRLAGHAARGLEGDGCLMTALFAGGVVGRCQPLWRPALVCPPAHVLAPLAAPQSLADALDSGDVEAFTTAVAEFDSLTRLDAWKTTLLVRVKRKISSRDEVEEEDLT